MTLSEQVGTFLEAMRYERRLSSNTTKALRNYLARFLAWLQDAGEGDSLESFSARLLRRYLAHLGKSGLTARTIHAAWYPLRSFGDWLVASGVLKANAAAGIQLPRKAPAHRQAVSDEELSALFDACERQIKPRDILLSRAVLSVLAYTALRREEVISLQVGDIDLAEKAITVRHGKGDKARKVAASADCMKALSAWLSVRPDTSAWLWQYTERRRLHYNGLKSKLDNLKAIAGLKEASHIQPHSIRHNCASRVYRNGAGSIGLKDVSEFLGHASVRTTEIYLHGMPEAQRRIGNFSALKVERQEQKRSKIGGYVIQRRRMLAGR